MELFEAFLSLKDRYNDDDYCGEDQQTPSLPGELAGINECSRRVGQASKSGRFTSHRSQFSAGIPSSRVSSAMFKYAILFFVSGTLASKVTPLAATCETLPSTVHITKGEPLNESKFPRVI